MLIKNEYKPQMLPKQPKGKKPVSTNGRIAFVLGGLALAFAALVGRGVYLQTTQHDFLKNQGDQRFVRTIALPASRGTTESEVASSNQTVLMYGHLDKQPEFSGWR